ncbi:tripartite tricarboxylate transporter permease [Microbaculum marinum]|uniref:Tripartite tricarboxylate transporter permease n=1 Tax=Microbaculum marinum TaxID=1764581 RepID=A0AAW9RNR3_9HYPH
METILLALELLFRVDVMIVILASAMFGLFMGAIPGLTATMATALLVPVTFFMDPVPAVAAIVTSSAMAIFAGDIPGTLLRIPGTPGSAAYVDDAYCLTQSGRAELCLGVNLCFSALGGLAGALVLLFAAPALARVVIRFGTFEYFWLAMLGLTCAAFISSSSLTKGTFSLLIGLLASCVGIGATTGLPRFTFGQIELMGGINFVPAMIGAFALSELIRTVSGGGAVNPANLKPIGNLFSGIARTFAQHWRQFLRGSTVGTVIGILPGAGSTLAAWVAYALAKQTSRKPDLYGKGSLEGIVASTSANNAAVSGAWVPALVFGIPGDAVTAIAIGVLFIKGLNPGPTIFINNPEVIDAVLISFLLANLLLIPLGFMFIKVARHVLRVPSGVLSPFILILSILGAFAINNTLFDVGVMLLAGVIAYFMEENGIPIAPAILGLLLGTTVEENFMTSAIKADGNLLAFFERPIAGTLGVLTIALWLSPLVIWLARRRSQARLRADG